MLTAEILAIGSEITTGVKLDTNSQWLSLELSDLGISTRAHMTVADDLDTMVAAMRIAVDRSDLLIITGGLGPTLDDLTRDALAKLAGVELVLDPPSLEHVKMMFAKRNRPMPERNVIQAMFPAGSEPLPNPRGTAPGIWLEVSRGLSRPPCRIAALPGVPSEMKVMFRQQVVPRIDAGAMIIRRARINCFGAGESQIEEVLGDLTARGRDPEVGITAHEATITLRVAATGSSLAECQQKISKTRETILNRLGTWVYGEEDEELEHAVVRLLQQRRLTVSTAEAGTGGLLAHRLTGVAGFEKNYLGGVVVPTSAAKCQLQFVDPDLLAAAGPTSAAVAISLAKNCRARFGTHFALAATQLPDFNTQDPLAPVPSSFVALACDGVEKVEEVTHFGDPLIARSRTAKTAMNLLRLHLVGSI